jgi:hypothetical protein
MINAWPHLHVIGFPLILALLVLLAIVHDRHQPKDIYGRGR